MVAKEIKEAVLPETRSFYANNNIVSIGDWKGNTGVKVHYSQLEVEMHMWGKAWADEYMREIADRPEAQTLSLGE
jgi:hypothetical protein